MMVPVVFLVLPVTVLFALFPGFYGLSPGRRMTRSAPAPALPEDRRDPRCPSSCSGLLLRVLGAHRRRAASAATSPAGCSSRS